MQRLFWEKRKWKGREEVPWREVGLGLGDGSLVLSRWVNGGNGLDALIWC